MLYRVGSRLVGYRLHLKKQIFSTQNILTYFYFLLQKIFRLLQQYIFAVPLYLAACRGPYHFFAGFDVRPYYLNKNLFHNNPNYHIFIAAETALSVNHR